jgi:ketosteroid isomerase-like protein
MHTPVILMRFLCSLVVLLIYLAPPVSAQDAPPPQPSSEQNQASVVLPPEMDRVLRDYETGWRNRDSDTLAELFTPDGFILRPSHSPVRGRDAIAEAYRNSGGPVALRALEFSQADSVGYIIGGYGGIEGGPDSGKFILTLRKLSDGRWYISADMDNSNY